MGSRGCSVELRCPNGCDKPFIQTNIYTKDINVDKYGDEIPHMDGGPLTLAGSEEELYCSECGEQAEWVRVVPV